MVESVKGWWAGRKVCRATLAEEHFIHAKIEDGRRYAYFWADGKKRAIYRYQWVWEDANEPILSGMVIHHRNGDPTDGRLENLELMSAADHRRHHARLLGHTATEKIDRICGECGETFCKSKKRGIKLAFCSRACSSTWRLRRTARTR